MNTNGHKLEGGQGTGATGLRLFHQGPYLRGERAGDRSWLVVKPVWAAPLSRPGEWLALVDEAGDELALVERLGELDSASRAAVEEELRRRYLTSTITRVVELDPQHGPVYFTVETDRGEATFLMQHLHDNAIWFSDTHLLMLDADSNRWEIPDITKLDDRSRSLLRIVM